MITAWSFIYVLRKTLLLNMFYEKALTDNITLSHSLNHGCFKSHIAAIERFYLFVRRSGTSIASKCKHGSSLDISFLSVTRIL